MKKVVIATRESRLALWQAEHVKALLESRLGWQVDLLGMTTQGDQILDRSLSEVGGKGLFVKELEVAVLKRPNPRAAMKILSVTPVRIPPGGSTRIEVGLPVPKLAERAQFELSNPPEGITIQSASPVRNGVEIVLQTDAAKVKPGLKGNLIINGYAPRPAETNAPKPKANNNQRMSLGSLPAIPFEIIPPP